MQLANQQLKIAQASFKSKTYLQGAAGTGKTTTGLARLEHLLASDVPPGSIMVYVPQRTLALPYYDLLAQPKAGAGEAVTVTTLAGISRRAVETFWLLVAEKFGFQQPQRRPTFLSLETAQYFMARVIAPVIEREGYFDTVSLDRNRLYSQLLDNLSKAAVVGFPISEIGERLKSAWVGDTAQLKVYEDVQKCVDIFRAYCLEHNLLDFSLQTELFMREVLLLPEFREGFFPTYQHLIIDNIEEDSPAAHIVMGELIEAASSALVINDSEAGYRRFLGADPVHAERLKSLCGKPKTFTESFVVPAPLAAFGAEIGQSLSQHYQPIDADPRELLEYDNFKYHPEMINGVAERVISLVVDQGVPPNEIVVLAPYLSDALRFSLMNRLQTADIPSRSHRPSRSLREEPAALCLLTLAQMAHPQWGLLPTTFDIVYALMESIADLDLVRAQLLARFGYTSEKRIPRLLPFEQIPLDTQERITFLLGERYERLRLWLDAYIEQSNQSEEVLELDHFFSRLFGEVLSQQGFGFHDDLDAAEVAANLIDSAQKFRWIVSESGALPEGKTLAQEYVEMVGQGVIADQYLRGWEVEEEKQAVLLAPAYTFLMMNRPVQYQFWLNVGGAGWAERLYQPLTNPYVLNQQWMVGEKWTDTHEVQVSQQALYHLVLGLVRRCRQKIYLGFSELGEQGYEQRGELLGAVQRMLRRLTNVEG